MFIVHFVVKKIGKIQLMFLFQKGIGTTFILTKTT